MLIDAGAPIETIVGAGAIPAAPFVGTSLIANPVAVVGYS
jgi:hypothetical protein